MLCSVELKDLQANKKFMTEYYGCKNDKAMSMILCNAKKGHKITVFDDGEYSSSADDWTSISVMKNFSGCITIPTFEKSQYVGTGKQVFVYYATSGNLDGKVSSFVIELLGNVFCLTVKTGLLHVLYT